MGKGEKNGNAQLSAPPPRRGIVTVDARLLAKLSASRVVQPEVSAAKASAAAFHTHSAEKAGSAGNHINGKKRKLSQITPSKPVDPHGTRKIVFVGPQSKEERLVYLLSTIGHLRDSGLKDGASNAVVFAQSLSAAAELVPLLRALGMFACTYHGKLSKRQRTEHVSRFQQELQATSSVLILADAGGDVILPSSISPTLFIHYDAAATPSEKAKRGQIFKSLQSSSAGLLEAYLEVDSPSSFQSQQRISLSSESEQQVRALVLTAKKLVALTGAGDQGDALSMTRAAASAGLEWDSAANTGKDSDHGELKAAAVAKREQITAIASQLQVLLLLGVAPRLPGAPSRPSKKVLRARMEAACIIAGIGAAFGASPDERSAAETCWLDRTPGETIGAPWGVIRKGASCDVCSLEARYKAIQELKGVWQPNPQCPDQEKWGGIWGKPCGHNEVAMHHARPFFPQEVINTKICSRVCPAPGNNGYDGCLEHLQIRCKLARQCMTIWDSTHFHFINERGMHTKVARTQLLCLSAPRIKWLMKGMRDWTLATKGTVKPVSLLEGLSACLRWGAKGASFGSLNKKLTSRVLSYVIGGGPKEWRTVIESVDIDASGKRKNGVGDKNVEKIIGGKHTKKKKSE